MICVVGVFGPPPLREKFYGDRGCRVEMDVFGPPPGVPPSVTWEEHLTRRPASPYGRRQLQTMGRRRTGSQGRERQGATMSACTREGGGSNVGKGDDRVPVTKMPV
jgi:hypothetical protein